MATESKETPKEAPKEVFLEADKEIPGQHYVCLSFISPTKVLKNKELYFFSEFMKDYEIQYKIKATESFVMAQVARVQEAVTKSQDVLENLYLKLGKTSVDLSGAPTSEDLSGALTAIRDVRKELTVDAAAAMEAHVKKEMSDFKESTLEEAYRTFLVKNQKKLEDAFFEKNEFRTTVQGLKVRGSYDTYGEAMARAKTLQKLDSAFNVYVAQVGFWLPWDPEPSEVADQEYADEQLNQLMKKYKENEQKRDELYAENKVNRMGNAKPRGVAAGGAGLGATAGAGAATSEEPPSNMFAGEDLAIARKREAEKK